jgi:hypothetical protein
MTNADDAMLAPLASLKRRGVELAYTRPLVVGDAIRDWTVDIDEYSLFPYEDEDTVALGRMPRLAASLWPTRTVLGNRATFGKSTYFDEGRPWWAWHQVAPRRAIGLTITFAFVATHNHFVLDRGGKVFGRSAPVLKLSAGSSESDHLGLLGLLNSALACFWLKQVSHNKGSTVDQHGARQTTMPFEDFYEFTGTKLADFPLPIERPVALARDLDNVTRTIEASSPAALLAAANDGTKPLPTRAALAAAHRQVGSLRRRQIALQEALDWRCYHLYGLVPEALDWEARFHRITLEDRNLPAIAEKRVLRPVDETARQTLQTTIDDVMKMRKDVLDTLLTTTADREMFRKVYPFSPALVQTLIAVSAALQRERTALKLMLQLLVDRRADLELGQLIPVGDLYDAIAEGDEPFSEGMRLHFDNAKRLHNQRLLPMLERQHGVTWEAIKLGQADPTAAKNLRNDARLLKTLLLGALVPEVESLKGLTAQRLAALNHGTFRSPIPGREAQDVLRKCRDWASEIGEIKITEDQNPVISIQVTGVDIEPILRAAEANDNAGNRRKKIRETLFEQLGIQDAGGLFTTYEFLWRGTRREVEVLYENVREMTDDRLRGRSGAWSVVLDFPFDDANFGPADDLARLGAYRGGDTRTLVWLPSFLSNKALADLGRLVVLDYILQGDRFDNYAAHLSFVDRVQAKALARNQLDQLRIKLRSQLEVAYGISTEPRDAVSNPLTADQQFQSLDPTLSPRPPVGAEFRSAFEGLLGQLFAHQYPGHPEFDTEIKASVIKKVWPEVQKAIESSGQRGFVQDTSTRKLVRAVVNPCQLGQMGETHLLIEPHWQSRFAQSHAREGGGPITVAKLRRWIDTPAPMGLPIELQNLIILAYAASTNRRFTLRGGPIEPTIDSVSDELELREQALPNPTDWDTALQRASSLFGLTLAQTLNAANVGRLVDEVKQAASGKREAVGRLVAQLRDRASRYGAGTAGARQQSAESAQALLATLTQAAEGDVVSSLAAATLNTSEAAVSRTLGQAQACADALTNGNWQLFDVVRDLGDHRREAAAAIMTRLGEVLIADEHVVPLKSRLAELERDAMQLLAATAPAPVTPPAPAPVTPGATTAPTPLPPPLPPAPGFNGPELVEEKQALHLTGAAAEAALDDLKARMARERDLELSLSWRLERKGTKL